jgi:hypothetical protein
MGKPKKADRSTADLASQSRLNRWGNPTTPYTLAASGRIGIGVNVTVGRGVDVDVGVLVGVEVDVGVGVKVVVAVGVAVCVGVFVGVGVSVAVGVKVAGRKTSRPGPREAKGWKSWGCNDLIWLCR